jgi:hypothetical protein
MDGLGPQNGHVCSGPCLHVRHHINCDSAPVLAQQVTSVLITFESKRSHGDWPMICLSLKHLPVCAGGGTSPMRDSEPLVGKDRAAQELAKSPT